jgi:methionyl-tRNA formyltransferase
VRLAFLGSPDFAVPALHALAEAGHHIAAVYCQPPRPAHRGQALTRCAVHAAALAMGLEVRTPARIRRDAAEHAAFAALGLDAAVVAAYGLILPPEMLGAPARGCLNIHASLLPRWRGAAPIHAAILAGDAETGVTIMQMDEGLDTGAMLLREAIPIPPRASTPDLFVALAGLGARLVVRALAENPAAIAQPDAGITYAAKVTRADSKLDFNKDAASLDRQIRALTPWPGTFALLRGDVLKILSAEPAAGEGAPGTILDAGFTVATGAGGLRLLGVQRAGRAAAEGEAFLRGVANWRTAKLT